MEPQPGSLGATLRLIESARLTPAEHMIWRAFLNEAIDPEYAAQYIWQKLNDRGGRPPEEVLGELKLEWKQVLTKCEPNRNSLLCLYLPPKQ